MKFLSILLKEGRKEDLRKKYSKKFDEETLNWILNISDLVDFNHKYTDFVLKNLDSKSDDLDMDVSTAVEIVKEFDKYQSKLEKRDINQYKSLRELDSALEVIIDEEKAKEKEKELEKQVDRVYEDDKFVVVRPKTHQASCKYGSNTKWCTTSQDTQHWERYSQGNQALYYIINKLNSTNKNYSKIAIHFDRGGYERYWDSKDSPMSDREVEIFQYAFPEIIEAVRNDYKKFESSSQNKFLDEVFNSDAVSIRRISKYLSSESNLVVSVEGFQTINDLGPGHAYGQLHISLNDNLIDSYQVFITFRPIKNDAFEASIGFMANDDPEDGEPFTDLGLEGWGFDSKYLIGNGLAQNTAESIRNHIAGRVLDYIKDKPELVQKVVGTAKVWRPNIGYGYTFGKNQGLIRKLMDYLESGKEGTKLDFLTDIGYLQKIEKDGEITYKRKNYKSSFNPNQLRGQHSSFFASAKNAGILGYRKVGRNYFLIKGPNFEAFKKGELKAL